MVFKTAGIKAEILKALRSSAQPISGQELADRAGVSRTAVWKHIESLRRAGCEISGSPRRGYALINETDVFLTEVLAAALPPVFKDQIVLRREVESTNNLAKDLASRGRLQPVGLVVAQTQTGGRGRFNRPWLSPPGGIWMTVVLRPNIPAALAPRAALLAAVIVVEAIRELTGLNALIKWPNDILINNKKVCGILTEMAAELGRVEYLAIGIGVNANFDPEIFGGNGPPATTILAELGRPIKRSETATRIAAELYQNLDRLTGDFTSVVDAWKAGSQTLNKQIILRQGEQTFAGVAVDVDLEGGLIVELRSGNKMIFRAGEVSVVKEAEPEDG